MQSQTKIIPDSRVRNFMGEHHVLSLATCHDNIPYCATAFYAYDESSNSLVINSSDDTLHARNMLQNGRIAGTIALETKIIGKIQGVQFCGRITPITDECPGATTLRKCYLKRFPYTSVTMPKLWVIELDFLKMTDNRLGFGKKIIWQKG